MTILFSNPARQAAGVLGGPVMQRCFTRGRKPFRAMYPGADRWRYFDSVEQCLDYLRQGTGNPALSEADVHKIAFNDASSASAQSQGGGRLAIARAGLTLPSTPPSDDESVEADLAAARHRPRA